MTDINAYLRRKEADLERLENEITRLKAAPGSADALQTLSDRYTDATAALDDMRASGRMYDQDTQQRTDMIFRLAFEALDRANRVSA